VNVRLHMAPRSQMQMCPSPDIDFVQAEIYLCFPFAATTAGNPNTRLLNKFSVGLALFQPDPSITRSKVCTVSVDHPFQLDAVEDQKYHGHRCLVARCFQHGLISSTRPTDFFVPDDQHYGQHNLNIAPAPQGQPVQHAILTVNGNREEPVSVTLRVVADLQPPRPLLELIVPHLRQIKGFKKLATTPYPGGFSLRLPDFPEAKILDYSGSEDAFYEAMITMEPDQETTFFFEVDTSDDEPGTARIYHVTHIENQRVIGGVTVVTVVF
jgi:hypothetical protein